jgi:tetratricopeptide (TPR) repeat protein
MLRSCVFVLIVALSGCAQTYNSRWSEPLSATASPTQSEQVKVLVEEGDAAWLLRDDPAKLKEALTKWEAAGAQWADGALYARLARAHYFYADAYLALETEAEARDVEYMAALDWSTRALKLQAPEFVAALAAGKSHHAAVQLAPVAASEALLWYASSLGKWAAARRFATRVKYKDDLKAVIDRVHAIDPSQHGATNRWLGGYEAQTINIAGGSEDRALAYFKKSLEIAPNYFGTKVLWAQFLCPKMHDRETYTRLLNEVIAADPASEPNSIAENKADQRKAKQLLADIDAVFSF